MIIENKNIGIWPIHPHSWGWINHFSTKYDKMTGIWHDMTQKHTERLRNKQYLSKFRNIKCDITKLHYWSRNMAK